MELKFVPKGSANSFLKLYEYAVHSIKEGKKPNPRFRRGRVKLGVKRVFTVNDLYTMLVKLIIKSTSLDKLVPEPLAGAYIQFRAAWRTMVSQRELIKSSGLNQFNRLASIGLSALTSQGLLLGCRTVGWRFVRTPLGEELVRRRLLNIDKPLESFLAIYVSSFYYPSKTSLIYLMMLDSSSKDPETVGKTLRSRIFNGQLEPLRRIAVETHEELYDTLYLGKLAARVWIEKRGTIPQTHITYRLAEIFREFMDPETYALTYLYLTKDSKDNSFAKIDGLKHLFVNIFLTESKIDALWKKPYGPALKVILDELSSTYGEVFREQLKFYRYVV